MYVWKKMQNEKSNHQDQVKELIEKTADSLDNLALKMLFVSIQQNNLGLCIKYAIEYNNLQPTSSTMVCNIVILIFFRHKADIIEECIGGKCLDMVSPWLFQCL